MRRRPFEFPILVLLGVVLLGPQRLVGSEPPPNRPQQPDLGRLAQAVRQVLEDFNRSEFGEMLAAVAKGSEMGPGDGWFKKGSQSRYGWQWLAARFDPEGTGRITRDRFRGPAELFARLDRDGDGVLTPADLDWSPAAMKARENPAASYLFYLLDADSNGRVTKAEWDAFFAKLSRGKGYVSVEDLRMALRPPAPPRPAAGSPPPKQMGPSRDVLLAGLLSGELGSICEGPRVGTRAPDFDLATQDGKRRVRLSDYRGHKPVVLIFGNFT